MNTFSITPTKAITAIAAAAVILSVNSASAFQAGSCSNYASFAVQQQRVNIQNACGFSGLRWHANFSAHKTFCDSFGPQLAKISTRERAGALNQCRTAGGRFINNEVLIVPGNANNRFGDNEVLIVPGQANNRLGIKEVLE